MGNLFPYNENRPAYFQVSISGTDITGVDNPDLGSVASHQGLVIPGGLGLIAPADMRLVDFAWVFGNNIAGDATSSMGIVVSTDCGASYGNTINTVPSIDTSSTGLAPTCTYGKDTCLIRAGEMWKPSFPLAISPWNVFVWRLHLGFELV